MTINKSNKIISVILFLFIINLQAEVSLKEKIGQMIMVGFYGTVVPDSLAYDLTYRNLGGVITLGYNLDYPAQIETLTRQIDRYAHTKPFIAIDQEGGFVARLDENNGFEETYSNYQLGTVFNLEDSTRASAAMMAGWLYDSGFNMNLAPVVDVNVNPTSPAIGYYERSFSDDPMGVYQHASWFISEFNDQKIITSLKHYPGHGSAQDDSHNGFTDITDTWSEEELIPYQELITDGYSDFVMTGHLYNSKLDFNHPATLSYYTLTELLRDSLKFNGLIISDEMYMRAIRDNYSFEEAIELAINAGIDVLLYITNMRDDKSLPGTIIDLVYQKVMDGHIPLQRIEESYNRIIDIKTKYFDISPIRRLATNNVPGQYELSNFPNPFNSKTKIVFNIPRASQVSLALYDINGRKIRDLARGFHISGKHQLDLDMIDLSSGVYFIRLSTIQGSISRKISLIK